MTAPQEIVMSTEDLDYLGIEDDHGPYQTRRAGASSYRPTATPRSTTKETIMPIPARLTRAQLEDYAEPCRSRICRRRRWVTPIGMELGTLTYFCGWCRSQWKAKRIVALGPRQRSA